MFFHKALLWDWIKNTFETIIRINFFWWVVWLEGLFVLGFFSVLFGVEFTCHVLVRSHSIALNMSIFTFFPSIVILSLSPLFLVKIWFLSWFPAFCDSCFCPFVPDCPHLCSTTSFKQSSCMRSSPYVIGKSFPRVPFVLVKLFIIVIQIWVTFLLIVKILCGLAINSCHIMFIFMLSRNWCVLWQQYVMPSSSFITA